MFQVQGVIVEIGQESSGVGRNGNTWTRLPFVIEYVDGSDNRKKKMSLNLWGKALGANIGTVVNVVFSIDSATYNQKYFTNLTAHEVIPSGVQPQVQQAAYSMPQQPQPQPQQYAQPTTAQAPPAYGNTVAQQQPTTQRPTAVVPNPSGEKDEDDLPF